MPAKDGKTDEIQLTLKTNEDGQVEVTESGYPLWVDPDGNEVSYDVTKLIKDKTAANAESAMRRKKIDELEAKLNEMNEKYQDIDIEAAKKAMETLQNIDQQKLMDTEGVESVKRQMKEAFKLEQDKEREAWEKQVKDQEVHLSLKTNQIRTLLIKNAFMSSEFLREKTLLPPDVAYSYFGNHFEVREVSGEPMAVGRLNGEDILSLKKNPGEIADTEEALEIIIDKSPIKERILKGNVQAGSGVLNPDQSKSDVPDILVKQFYPSMHRK